MINIIYYKTNSFFLVPWFSFASDEKYIEIIFTM